MGFYALIGALALVRIVIDQRRFRRRLAEEKKNDARAFVLAVPASLRVGLEPLVATARERRTSDALMALRDALVEQVSSVRFAAVSTWRGATGEFAAWVMSVAGPAKGAEGLAKSAGYRDADVGLAVLVLAIQHSCDLLDSGDVRDAGALRLALESSIPANDSWLTHVDVHWEPSDRDAAYDDSVLPRAFPQLRALQGRSS